METSKMKNMIVLSNPSSNLIEEAIIILKNNKRFKMVECIENKKNNIKNKIKEEDYIIKEAECVISDYMNKIEKDKIKNKNIYIERKYKKIKWYSIIISILFIMSIIKIFS